MRIQRSSRQGCVVLTLAGRLDVAAAPQLQRVILKQLAERPPAIICDLGQVEDTDPLCARVFTAIRHPALGWPGTALVLCAVRPQVADTLVRLGVARQLTIYPSLDQALRNARVRPPRLREGLPLGPVPTAARASRFFVREVCDRWGIGELTEPPALVASELVTNAVGHARTALELQVELRGHRLRVAVKDQDPTLARVLAAKGRVGGGLGLVIVDRVATAWGVRQDGADGKTVWCTMDLPAQQAAKRDDGDRQLPARTRGSASAVAMRQAGHGPSGAIGVPGTELEWSKLRPPAPRAGQIPRTSLVSRLEAGLGARLCLLAAPPGSGKTTLLSQCRAAAGADRVAWVTLDDGDNDPTRFWTYLVEALRTIEADMGTAALQALQRTSIDLDRAVLPSLLNDLGGIGAPLVLVLDDYHLVTNPVCHQTLAFFLDHLPPGIHLALATRADPPLPLARMRARGELVEFRARELQFSDQEARELLNGAMGLRLASDDVERLAEQTEGWAAGLVLAGLSLRGRPDPSGFIAAFGGNNRQIADYLSAEVLERQPEDVRAFLLRTSVLQQLSGPLCDRVLETEGSAKLLEELERFNLFLVPLDDRRQWYRYHQLFAELLRLELGNCEPELIPALHRRAAAWYRAAGQVDEAIYHATAAGEFAEANALIAAHWLAYWRRGQRAIVARWLQGLPEEAITAHPPVAFVAAWIGGLSGAAKQETDRWLAAVEDPTWEGALPDGISSLAFGAALARAVLVFDDVAGSAAAARRALELAGPQPSPYRWMAQAALGQALYLAGQATAARPGLQELIRRVQTAEQPYAVVTALAVLSLLAGDEGDDQTATALAARAAASAEARALNAEPLCGIVHLALGQALIRQGELIQAEEQLERALELFGTDSMVVHRAHGLLLLASVRHGGGDLPSARTLVDRARALIERFAAPGVLPVLLEQTERELSTAPRRRVEAAAPLTERELAVLRLLPTRLSTREIGRELYVSVNTIRTHVQAIYRKLQVNSRADAVTHARQLHLLP